MGHVARRTLIHLAWKMANARRDIQNHLLDSQPWTNMVFQSIFAQMMVAYIRLEVSVWTTDGSFLSAHFFPQHLTVTSMLNVLHPLLHINTSSNMFRKALISHHSKSMDETRLKGTQRVITFLHLKHVIAFINSTFMVKSQMLFVFRYICQ